MFSFMQSLKSQLRSAVENGNEKALRDILQKDPSLLNQPIDESDQPALIKSCVKNKLALVNCLLTYEGIDVNLKSKIGNTALLAAALNNRPEIIRVLISRPDVEINVVNKNGESVLFLAAQNCDESAVRLLLSRPDLDVNLSNEFGHTALMIASRLGRTAIVQILLLDERVNRDLTNQRGDTAAQLICHQTGDKSQEKAIQKLFQTVKPVKKPATAVVAAPAPVKEISSIPPAATTIATNQKDSPAKTTPTSTATAAKDSKNKTNETDLTIPETISSVKWNRGKIMIVGAGRAGKTALTRSLIGEEFTAQLESTIGINEFTCNVKSVGLSGKGGEWGKCEEDVQGGLLESAVARQLTSLPPPAPAPAPPSSTSAASPAVSLRSTPPPAKPLATPATPIEGSASSVSKKEGGGGEEDTPDRSDSFLPQEIDSFEFAADLSKTINQNDFDHKVVRTLIEGATLHQSKYIVSIYDFGGQSVFNSIHPFFLTKYGVYIIAFDMNQLHPDNNNYQEDHKECLSYIRFWLNSIAIHSLNPITKLIAPIFLVGSRKDKIMNPRDHENISHLLYEHFHHHQAWPFIIQNEHGIGARGNTAFCFFPVDNTKSKTRSDPTISELLKLIELEISKSPYVNHELPAVWLKTIDKLKKLNLSAISLNEIKEITQENGISSNLLPSFLTFLHEMGIAMWHRDPSLCNMIIFDPIKYFVEPATLIICKHRPIGSDATWHYTSIHRNCNQQYPADWQLFLKSGILTEVVLKCLLSSIPHRDLIISLMIKYGLLLELTTGEIKNDKEAILTFLRNYGIERTGKLYLVPALLSNTDKKASTNKNQSMNTDVIPNSCHRCYFGFYLYSSQKAWKRTELSTISFLPNGLFDRLICRLIVLCMKELYLEDLTSSVSSHSLSLRYGGELFELHYDSVANLLELIVYGNNPIPIYLLILGVIQQILLESFPLLRCMTLLPDKEQDEEEDPWFIRLSAIEEAIRNKTNLVYRQQISCNFQQLLTRYNLWLYQFKQTLALSRYDVFISYRWNDQDSPLVGALFDALMKHNLSNQQYSPAAIFLDRNRLETGKDFRADFVSALTHSNIVVPIVSVEALKRMTTHNPKEVDNLLLEWILSLHLLKENQNQQQNDMKIIPIIFGSHVKDLDTQMIQTIRAIYEPHGSLTVMAQLSTEIPTATLQAAARFLGKELRAELTTWSVAKIVQELLASNTPFFENEGKLKRFLFPITLRQLAEDYALSLFVEMRRSWQPIQSDRCNEADRCFYNIRPDAVAPAASAVSAGVGMKNEEIRHESVKEELLTTPPPSTPATAPATTPATTGSSSKSQGPFNLAEVLKLPDSIATALVEAEVTQLDDFIAVLTEDDFYQEIEAKVTNRIHRRRLESFRKFVNQLIKSAGMSIAGVSLLLEAGFHSLDALAAECQNRSQTFETTLNALSELDRQRLEVAQSNLSS